MIKILRYSLNAFFVSLLLMACQKELNLQTDPNTPGTNSGTARYSFAGGTGTCTNAVISGVYNKGAILDNTNTVVIKINVDTLGTFSIATASINGIIFKATGAFTTIGNQSITLIGAGAPVTAGSFIFTPGATGCSFKIDFTATGSTSGTASFTLNGSPADCIAPIINGNYLQGVPLNGSDSVIINATVTTIGSYIITTNTVNGMFFTTNGTFTTTGAQTITLIGTGTPLTTGSFNFIPGTNGCLFKVTAAQSIVTGCKDCIYMPMCVGTKYAYIDTFITPDFVDTGSVKVIQTRQSMYVSAVDTIMNNSSFKKLGASDGTTISYSYLNCINGELRLVENRVQSTTSGNVYTNINSIELKTNAAVGTTWSDTSNVNTDAKLYRTHTISDKGISRLVNGVTYNDVISVTVVQTIQYNDPSIGTISAGIAASYYAKNIGVIESIGYTINPITNENLVIYHAVIKSYLIP